jgi:hypothetical protein
MQTLNKTLDSTVASAFKCTGIFPFNKNAVKALIPDTKPEQSTPEDVKSVPGESESVCDHCGHTKENALVKLGIISEDLSSILVEPPLPNKQKSASKRKTYKNARLLLHSEPEKKKKKTYIKNDELSLMNNDDTHLLPASDENQQDQLENEEVCVVCMVGDRPEYSWVGCDKCDKWYHYECLPSYVQTDVDLSLVTSTRWLQRSNC